MSHGSHPNMRPPNHTNAFIDLNGLPYLLGEYTDRTQFRQIDKSIIKSDLFVDQTESMRAVVDVSINDLQHASDGSLISIGNHTKYKNLLNIIARHANRLEHRFDVMKSGIVVRVNYRLENQRTKQVIRSTTEDLRINNRNYFIDINPADINDNAIITNFSDSIVSTLNEFTHGIDRMIIRITSIQMFYEVLSKDSARVAESSTSSWYRNESPHDIRDCYYYHSDMQSQHHFHQHHDREFGCVTPAYPPSWLMFNRFYRFDNMGRDLILHMSEIYDRNNKVVLIPCGMVHINRSFLINPGHRIIFKFSIWKNDLTSVNDTQRVAQAIGTHSIDSNFPDRPHDECHDKCHHEEHHEHHIDHHNFNMERLVMMMLENSKNSISNDKLIEILRLLNEFKESGHHEHPHHPHPLPPPMPPVMVCPHCGQIPCICHCMPPLDPEDDECCLPISNEEISNILDGF